MVEHIINRVLSKSVPKTPYELWAGRKPSINYFYVWVCSAEAKIFNPQIGILDPKTISCHFIGYLKKVQGLSILLSKPYHEIYGYESRCVL
jgi:hypothetical protein